VTEPAPTGVSDSGQGLTDQGQVSSTSPASTTQTSQEQPLNPSWEPVLKDLPEYFHEKAKGHFRSWDDNYRKLESEYNSAKEKYSPYEQYLGVDPDAIKYGLGMLQRVQNEPMALYTALQEHVRQLGLLKDEQQQQQQASDPNSVDLSEDPRYAEFVEQQRRLDERQTAIDQYIQQQVYDQQVSGYERDVDGQVQSVVQKYGQNAVDVEDLLQRMFIQTQRGGNFDAEAAYQEQIGTFKRLYEAQSKGRPAPSVIPTGGGTPAPSGEINPKDMNEDQRKAYFKHLLDLANSGG
jgi:hypothetical protein